MIIDHPTAEQIPHLKALWREAFGDGDDVINTFFTSAYAADRCCAVTENGQTVASAYYLRCEAYGRPVAYIYAVAVATEWRGRGICRALMGEMHRRLTREGYAGAVLVPATDGLFAMYEGLGYTDSILIDEKRVSAGRLAALLCERIGATEYARLRRALLPSGGAVQENESIRYLSAAAELYRTPNGIACVFTDGGVPVSAEVLGEELTHEPEGCVTVRCPGVGKRFALYKSLDGSSPAPTYFGIAFD